MEKKNVLIIQRSIAHFRMPLFLKLNESKLYDFSFCVGSFDYDTSSGIKPRDFKGLNIIKAKVRKIGEKLFFQKIINLKKFDIIIMDISINSISTPIYIFYAKLLGIKVIGWGKGLPQNNNKNEGKIKKAYKRFLAEVCDKLLLYGQVSFNYFVNLGIDKQKLIIAQNTIDTQALIDISKSAKEKANKLKDNMHLTGKFIFGYFGKIKKSKKVHCIIESFIKHKEISKSDDILIIAGFGVELDNLESFAKESKMSNSILFLGRIDEGQEAILINLFDVYLSFSQAGLGILESMALSKLIVSTPEVFPETELLINNYNCLLSKDFSIGEYTLTMKKAKELNFENRREIETNAVNTVKDRATIDNMVNAFEKALTEV